MSMACGMKRSSEGGSLSVSDVTGLVKASLLPHVRGTLSDSALLSPRTIDRSPRIVLVA